MRNSEYLTFVLTEDAAGPETDRIWVLGTAKTRAELSERLEVVTDGKHLTGTKCSLCGRASSRNAGIPYVPKTVETEALCCGTLARVRFYSGTKSIEGYEIAALSCHVLILTKF